MVASTTATNPIASWSGPWAAAMITMAPTRITPWMALLPDIRGVCRMVGTLEMTSKPRKTASTKIEISLTS